MPVELRPYQIEAVEKLRNNFKLGYFSQLLCAPTGSGKTEIALEVIKGSQKLGARAFFVCDLQTLVRQTSERMDNADIEHGILMGKESTAEWRDTLICSAQTLEARGFQDRQPTLFGYTNRLERPNLIVIDEAHAKREKVLRYCTENNVKTIGLTATPFTKGLGNFYQTIVNVETTQRLIDQGYLAPLRVVAPAAQIDVESIRINSRGEFERDEMSERVMQIVGDVVKEWEKHTKEHFGGPVPTIAFCPSVADSMELAQKFQAAGYNFQVVHFRQSAEEKQEIINFYKRGECDGLISCVALTKGFDAPATMCMIDTYGLRKSLMLHLQKIGRIMRTAHQKKYGLIIDHVGNWLGFYDATHRFFESGCNELD